MRSATLEAPPVLDPAGLKDMARLLRLDVLDVTAKVGGHVSSCFSCVEILTAVYFGGVLNYRPEQPDWPERDRFVLSKGHAAPVFYPVLARAGYAPLETLKDFRTLRAGLHGHPIAHTYPGVENTSGSLGQGLSFGLGTQIAARLSSLDYHTFVMLGDGECQEGQIWEAAMAAAHWKAERLHAIVDHNKYQQTGPIEREMSFAPFAAKWEAFGWRVFECDGHDLPALVANMEAMREVDGQPSILIAHTRKGKGVSFVEQDYGMHGRNLTPEQDRLAREEIRCL
jgi:transketolase